MKERNQLLKIGGICLFLLGIIDLIMGIVSAVQTNNALTALGALGGALGEELGADGASALGGAAIGSAIGGGIAGVMMVITIIGAALYIITGLLGFKGNSLTACKVLGIIVLVLVIIGFIGSLGTILVSPVSFILNLVILVIALVYVIGAFKSVKE